jgi:membrane associated rhomboid family serine protease
MPDYFRHRSRRPVSVDWGRLVREDVERSNQVVWGLIAVNVAVFVLWNASRGTVLQAFMADHFLVSLESVVHLRLWTLVTASVSHRDPMHLLFNLLMLYGFGRGVGQALGWRTLLHLYLAGGVAAALGHVLYSAATGDLGAEMGASGAIMAISVMFAALYPKREILFQFFLPVPAAVLVAGYVVLDVVGVLGGGGGGLANASHLAGAAYGLAWWRFRVR